MEKTKKKKYRKLIKLGRTHFPPGNTVPRSAIYECSECENVTAFKKAEIFIDCENCNPKIEGQYWYKTNEFVRFVSKNLNTEFAKIEGIGLRVSDRIAEFAGNVWFVIFHIIWFSWWIYTNTGHSSFGLKNFDVYPFGLLTMIVSLEAIFLATFILISQNRQSQKSELRAELDYQTNLNTEKDVAEVLSILRDIREDEKNFRSRMQNTARKGMHEHEIKRSANKKHKKQTKAEDIIEEAGIDNIEPAI